MFVREIFHRSISVVCICYTCELYIISVLKQAINFSSLTALKIFTTINAGAELGLATSLSFFHANNCIYHLYGHMNEITSMQCHYVIENTMHVRPVSCSAAAALKVIAAKLPNNQLL